METAKYIEVIREKAALYNVSSLIHKEDFIFEFLIENRSFTKQDDAINYYFMDGEKSARKLLRYVREFYPSDKPIKLLEFASGYGCVTRHFRNVLDSTLTTSCDIHAQAVEFIRADLGLPAIASNSVPEKFQADVVYDVVFALSFFSHMPKTTWRRWLKALARNTTAGGHVMFTTHGHASMKWFGKPVLDADGFWFKAESEQKDLASGEYGQTIVSPDFVFRTIAELGGLELVLFRKAGWWEHQDLYIAQVS